MVCIFIDNTTQLEYPFWPICVGAGVCVCCLTGWRDDWLYGWLSIYWPWVFDRVVCGSVDIDVIVVVVVVVLSFKTDRTKIQLSPSNITGQIKEQKNKTELSHRTKHWTELSWPNWAERCWTELQQKPKTIIIELKLKIGKQLRVQQLNDVVQYCMCCFLRFFPFPLNIDIIVIINKNNNEWIKKRFPLTEPMMVCLAKQSREKSSYFSAAYRGL